MHIEKKKEKHYLKAILLFNTDDEKCSFELGKIPCKLPVEVNYFFAQTEIEAYQKVAHPAPRAQYVVTLKGTLKFTVSDGSSFIVEPGTILIAKDVLGEGHSWDIIDGQEWKRIYIPIKDNQDDQFILDPEF